MTEYGKEWCTVPFSELPFLGQTEKSRRGGLAFRLRRWVVHGSRLIILIDRPRPLFLQ